MFRLLNEKEEADFRLWARENYAVGAEISELWHPVVQDECRRICEKNKTAAGSAERRFETDCGLKN